MQIAFNLEAPILVILPKSNWAIMQDTDCSIILYKGLQQSKVKPEGRRKEEVEGGKEGGKEGREGGKRYGKRKGDGGRKRRKKWG